MRKTYILGGNQKGIVGVDMKRSFIALFIMILFSSIALAQSNVNVSILYGWNGTEEVIE